MVVLRKGSRGSNVERLQHLLNTALVPSPQLRVDGDFGQRTHDAVIRFQQQSSLRPDGVVGAQTWTALGQRMAPASQPAVNFTPLQTTWMAIAEVELGVHEEALPGHHTPRIVEYHSTTTLRATDDETPWCSSFVNWVMIQGGYQGTNSARARSWLNWGISIHAPQLGAVTVIKKKNANSDAATGSPSGFHVGFFVSATATHVRLLGGNQSNQVKYSSYPLSQYELKGYRWPS